MIRGRKKQGMLSVFILLAIPAIAAQPKSIVLMIGDGMGPEQVKAAGMYLNGKPGTLNFELFPGQATITTAAADQRVTDSAAAATAIATGVKVNYRVVSMALPGDGHELATMLEFCKNQGKSTGLVTTTEITHATPAAFGAHEPLRTHRAQIGWDDLNQTRPNVLMGGADSGLTPEQIRTHGHYTLLENRAQLNGIDTDHEPYVAGLFGATHMPYEYDYDQGMDSGYDTLPHLNEMTRVALDLLDNDPDGFFLMVEGGRIDHAGHMPNDNLALKTGRNIFEVLEFAKAIQEVLDWASRNDPGLANTLIIVTADHETGGLTVTETQPKAGIFPAVTWEGSGHTAANVPLAAIGVRSELISGDMNNTDVFAVVSAPDTETPSPDLHR